MRILAACSLGGAGHFRPMEPLLATARRQGVAVLVIGPASLQRMVEEAGYDFEPGGEPPESTVAPIRDRLAQSSTKEASILANRILFGHHATAALLPAMERSFHEWKPTLVLREVCEYASAAIAHRTRTPVAQVAISRADVEWGSIDVASPALEQHLVGLTEVVRQTPYLTHFPESFDPSLFRYTLRFREQRPNVRPAPPDRWRGSTGPKVYVTFGTVLGHMEIATAAYRMVIEAVEGLDINVVMTVGHKFDPTLLGTIPHNVRIESWVEQSELLDGADLVVCHAGSGTMLGALATGVPLVAVPLFADQFANASQLQVMGAGVAIPELDEHAMRSKDTTRLLASEIMRVLNNPRFAVSAKRLADEISEMPAPREALQLLGRTLQNS